MKAKTVLIVILIALLAVLILQNMTVIPIRLFFWPIIAPLFILVFLIFVFGFLAGFLSAKIGRGNVPSPRPRATEPPPPPPVNAP